MPKALKQKQEYGIPLSRYTVFLQNCPLGHDPKGVCFLLVLLREFCVAYEVSLGETRRNVTNPFRYAKRVRVQHKSQQKTDTAMLRALKDSF